MAVGDEAVIGVRLVPLDAEMLLDPLPRVSRLVPRVPEVAVEGGLRLGGAPRGVHVVGVMESARLLLRGDGLAAVPRLGDLLGEASAPFRHLVRPPAPDVDRVVAQSLL